MPQVTQVISHWRNYQNFDGYTTSKWDTLKKELKDLYWQLDTEEYNYCFNSARQKSSNDGPERLSLKFTAITVRVGRLPSHASLASLKEQYLRKIQRNELTIAGLLKGLF